VTKNFLKILKLELIYYIPQLQLDQARIEIFEFIALWQPSLQYNRKRKHSNLSCFTLEQFPKLNQTIAA